MATSFDSEIALTSSPNQFPENLRDLGNNLVPRVGEVIVLDSIEHYKPERTKKMNTTLQDLSTVADWTVQYVSKCIQAKHIKTNDNVPFDSERLRTWKTLIFEKKLRQIRHSTRVCAPSKNSRREAKRDQSGSTRTHKISLGTDTLGHFSVFSLLRRYLNTYY